MTGRDGTLSQDSLSDRALGVESETKTSGTGVSREGT